MKKYILGLIIIGNLYAQDIQLEAYSWNLVGFANHTDISDLDLTNTDTIWNYDDGNWSFYKKDFTQNIGYNKISSLKAGKGFWIYSEENKTISSTNTSLADPIINQGWNLITPIFANWNIEKKI
jgi:hypothetical protein